MACVWQNSKLLFDVLRFQSISGIINGRGIEHEKAVCFTLGILWTSKKPEKKGKE
ncbi:hypothetical protein R84B8_00741 [Treponema sp. R8-4-B8]